MILLEQYHPFFNTIIGKNLVCEEGGKIESVDSTWADEDGNMHHIHSVPKEKTKIMIEMSCSFFNDIKSIGIADELKLIYSAYEAVTPSPNYHFAFVVNIENHKDKIDKVAQDFGCIRLTLYECIFKYFIKKMNEGVSENLFFAIKKGEEIFIESKEDRITVIFCLEFASEDDAIMGRIFMQEFKEGRKSKSSAPQVIITHKQPPAELSHPKVSTGPTVSYLTFVLTKSQHCQPQKIQSVSELLGNFFPYLRKHIMCSKTYLNQRMRAKCSDFVKILERAKPEESKKEKKTISGKTFKQN